MIFTGIDMRYAAGRGSARARRAFVRARAVSFFPVTMTMELSVKIGGSKPESDEADAVAFDAIDHAACTSRVFVFSDRGRSRPDEAFCRALTSSRTAAATPRRGTARTAQRSHRGAPDVPHLEHARDPSGERLVRAVTRADRAPTVPPSATPVNTRFAQRLSVRPIGAREFSESACRCARARPDGERYFSPRGAFVVGRVPTVRGFLRKCSDALFAGSAPILGSPSSLGVTETQGSVFSRP